MRIITSILFIAVLFVAVFSQTDSRKQMAWEYKFLTEVSEEKANELGSQGWELVATQSASGVTFSSVTSAPPQTKTILMFKRAKK